MSRLQAKKAFCLAQRDELVALIIRRTVGRSDGRLLADAELAFAALNAKLRPTQQLANPSATGASIHSAHRRWPACKVSQASGLQPLTCLLAGVLIVFAAWANGGEPGRRDRPPEPQWPALNPEAKSMRQLRLNKHTGQ